MALAHYAEGVVDRRIAVVGYARRTRPGVARHEARRRGGSGCVAQSSTPPRSRRLQLDEDIVPARGIAARVDPLEGVRPDAAHGMGGRLARRQSGHQSAASVGTLRRVSSVVAAPAAETTSARSRKTIWIFGRNWDLFISLA